MPGLEDRISGIVKQEYAIDGLLFRLTATACPEQYDVTDGRGRADGYVRLRHGTLRVDYPDHDGREIYRRTYPEGQKGCFWDEKERKETLEHIATVIKDERRRRRSNG